MVLTGGMDYKAERQKLKEKPHVIVATPGRLLDHLKRTRGFSLDSVKYLVSFVNMICIILLILYISLDNVIAELICQLPIILIHRQ